MFVDTLNEMKSGDTSREAHIPGVGALGTPQSWKEMLENTTFPRTNQKCASPHARKSVTSFPSKWKEL
jgi:hypothetical protein